LEIEVDHIEVRLGQVLIVAGPNGVGKSALLSEIARGIGGGHSDVETFFGSRQIQFQNEEVDQVGQNLKQFQSQLNSNVTRYRHPWGEQHLKSVVRRILNQESQTNSDVVDLIEAGSDPRSAMGDRVRTIKAINSTFASARLPVRFYLEEGTLRVRRGQATYNIDRLSDGERAALLVAGAVLIRPRSSFIVIDEPERHLNPAISGPLLSALVRVRTDLGFIFSTHDLNLMGWLQPGAVIHLRDSDLVIEQPEQRRYDYSLVSEAADIPEELRFAILGTRKRLLLVEGTSSSDDQALYGHLYPGWNIVAKGSCQSVISGVKALSEDKGYHWLKVAGIIDGDGRSQVQVEALAREAVHVLPVPTVENLFLSPTVLAQMADAAHELFTGPTGAQLLAAVETMLVSAIDKAKDEIVARRIVWKAQRLASTHMISVKNVRSGVATEIPAIDLNPLRAEAEAELVAAIGTETTIASLQSLPIKETRITHDVVKTLGFRSFEAYKQAVLGQIESDTARGRIIRAALKQIVPQVQP
jgi:ABC-type cobalamin/Fe3+-siderophores transport system ATPase subunit